MTMSERGKIESVVEGREKQIQLLVNRQTTGTTDNCVDLSVMREDSLALLVPLVGQRIKLTATEERWIYTGPDSDEDHSTFITHIEGTFTRVDQHGVEISAEKGEVIDDMKNTRSIQPGPMQFPFRKHEFNLRHSARIIGINRIETPASTSFRINP